MKTNNRFKNYGLWIAVASFVGMVLQDAGVPISPTEYQEYVDAGLKVLVLAGVVINPSIGKGYKDNTDKAA